MLLHKNKEAIPSNIAEHLDSLKEYVENKERKREQCLEPWKNGSSLARHSSTRKEFTILRDHLSQQRRDLRLIVVIKSISLMDRTGRVFVRSFWWKMSTQFRADNFNGIILHLFYNHYQFYLPLTVQKWVILVLIEYEINSSNALFIRAAHSIWYSYEKLLYRFM